MEPKNIEQRRLELIRARYEIDPINQIAPLTGGEWKTLWRLDSARTAYVVSISHPTATVASITYEHRLLRFLHAQLPQVPAPLPERDGGSYVIEQGEIISVFPLMPGQMVDRDLARLPAARFLARFHQVGRTFPNQSARPGVSAWRDWDWSAAAWPAISVALANRPQTTNISRERFWQATGAWAPQIIERREQIVAERTHFQQWGADLAQSDRTLTSGLIHDDYHGNNLLLEDGQVTALLDWDGCHPDWLVLDVANGLWEFCQDKDTHALDVHAARSFLDAYVAAGGVVPEQEFDLLIPAIRCRRMIEIMASLQGIVLGEVWDESPDYLVHNLIALENLRGISL